MGSKAAEGFVGCGANVLSSYIDQSILIGKEKT